MADMRDQATPAWPDYTETVGSVRITVYLSGLSEETPMSDKARVIDALHEYIRRLGRLLAISPPKNVTVLEKWPDDVIHSSQSAAPSNINHISDAPDFDPQQHLNERASRQMIGAGMAPPTTPLSAEVLEQAANQFIRLLLQQGAERKWVKASYSDIMAACGLAKSAQVPAVIHLAMERRKSLRKCIVISGRIRGNHFTFNAELLVPAKAVW